MKRVKLVIHESLVNKLIGAELLLQLDDKANCIDVINEVDRLINERGGFPLQEYRSLLHMVYDPIKNRFYNQVAVSAYKEAEGMINLRVDPRQQLPADVTVVLIPAGGCISEWEDAVDFEEFSKAVQKG